MYTSDDSLIDNTQLMVSDTEVTFEVKGANGEITIFSMTTKEYADSLEEVWTELQPQL